MPFEVKVVTDLIKASEYNGFFDSGFNIADFAQKAVFRGLKGEDLWTSQMLELVMARFRQHIASHEMEPEKTDEFLSMLSSKIIVDLDRIRRCFYGIPEPKTAKDVEEAPFNEATMNPVLETVLAVSELSKAAWKALPDSLKKRVHNAVAVGKTELAKRLVSGLVDESELVELFP